MVVKMDVEGAEWPVLNAMTAEDHSKILLFDLEIHWCRGFDKYSYVPTHVYTCHAYARIHTYMHIHTHARTHIATRMSMLHTVVHSTLPTSPHIFFYRCFLFFFFGKGTVHE